MKINIGDYVVVDKRYIEGGPTNLRVEETKVKILKIYPSFISIQTAAGYISSIHKADIGKAFIRKIERRKRC